MQRKYKTDTYLIHNKQKQLVGGGSFSVEGSVRVERDSDGNTKAFAGGSLGGDF